MRSKSLQNIFLFLLLGTAALLAEPSVYGFNNTGVEVSREHSAPTMKQNRATIASLKQKIAQLNERIDGLTTIVEGLSVAVNELRQGGTVSSSTSFDASSGNTVLLKKLGAMIDKINGDYVSKAQLQKALKATKTYRPSSGTEKKPEESSVESLEGKATSKLYSEGVRLFAKKRYSEAKKRFTITDTKGYKPAASNYYLGEIAYYTKRYEDAIFYFKKSAGLYDQASYIDTLLLHTAVSLEKNGDKEQAKVFYENIIENYRGKKSAKIAKQKLKNL